MIVRRWWRDALWVALRVERRRVPRSRAAAGDDRLADEIDATARMARQAAERLRRQGARQ